MKEKNKKEKTTKKETEGKTRAALLNLIEDAERSRKEAAKEKEKASAVIDGLTDGLIVLSKKGEITKVNPKLEEILSVEEKEVVGKKLKELKENSSFSKIVEIIWGEKGIKETERQQINLLRDRVVEITTVAIKKEEKREGYLLIVHDVSREKRVERLKTEFVSLSAHQLRTPLSGMKWTLKMLLDEDVGKLNKGQKELLGRLYRNNERMVKLIADLLDVTKLEEGKYLYYHRKEDILEIAGQIIPSLEEQAKQKGLKFKFSEPKEKIPKIKMDKEKIGICMQNLIRNSIKYTDSGGKVTVNLKYDKKNKEVLFYVEDTGMGIPKDKQKRVFTKFFRTSKAMKKETVGSGLGLYMSKNIIEAHGGKVWFESEEEKGSTFYFSLPAKQ